MTPISATGSCSLSPLSIRIPKGFTLLEVMLVLVVLSVMVSMLAINLSDNPLNELEREAQRLQKVMQMAVEDALLEGVEDALAPGINEVDQAGYQIVKLGVEEDTLSGQSTQPGQTGQQDRLASLAASLDPEQLRWLAIEAPPFAFYPLPEYLRLNLELLDGRDSNRGNYDVRQAREQMQSLQKQSGLQQWQPEVLILSSGEITPFMVTLSHEQLDQQVLIGSDGLAEISLELTAP